MRVQQLPNSFTQPNYPIVLVSWFI
jgi:hypothetical protein